jgi:hypothetical protein
MKYRSKIDGLKIKLVELEEIILISFNFQLRLIGFLY